MRDFLRETAFLDNIPLLPDVSSSLQRTFSSAAASSAFCACTAATNFLAQVRAVLFAALFRKRRTSLCLCLFTADEFFTAKGKPSKQKLEVCYQTALD